MNDILNEISLAVNINHYKVFFTGGGSIVLKDIIKNILPEQCVLLDDQLYSNVKGALVFSKQYWSSENNG